ncbi:DsrE family protein [Trichloromonas sp.]|uniref:DsrE family protein n=1 Tax=Trichloromonas sp. TaxID=3069249 RepID=UPI003D816028
MFAGKDKIGRRIFGVFLTAALVALMAAPVLAAGYDNALKSVTGYDAVFDVSLGVPDESNIVFWAVKNAYEAPEVKALAKAPNIAIVFHGPAVKLLSADKSLFTGAEWAEVEKFQGLLRQMKKDGVTLEVCLYAAEVMGVDKATIIPGIDRVDNGFVSVIGYQMQGYAVVRIP